MNASLNYIKNVIELKRKHFFSLFTHMRRKLFEKGMYHVKYYNKFFIKKIFFLPPTKIRSYSFKFKAPYM